MVKKNIRKDKNNFLESLNLNLFDNKSAKKSYNGILIIAGILGVLFLSGLVVGWVGDAVNSGNKITDAISLLNSTNEKYNASFTNPNFTFNEGTGSVLRFNISSLGLATVPSRNITAINVSFDNTFVITNYTFNVTINGSTFSTYNISSGYFWDNWTVGSNSFFNKQYDNGTVNGTLLLLHVNRTLTDNRSVFHWLNMSDDYGLLGNGTQNQSFYFNFFENVPGNYNITVLLENDTGAAGATRNTTLFRIRINDTTAPNIITLNGNSTGAGSITPIYSAANIPATTSKVNLSSKSQAVTLFISINATDFNESLDAGRIGYAGQGIISANFSVYNDTGWVNSSLVNNSNLNVSGPGANVATLDYNFTSHRGSDTLQQNFTDGNYMIVVKNITDIGGNRNFTVLAYNVTIDGTNPSVTVAKDATSTGHKIVLALTVSDATSGINGKQCSVSGGGVDGITMSGTTGSQTSTQEGLGCNTAYTYTVACTDHAGNTNSQSVTVNTDGCTGGGGTSSGTSGGSGSDVVGSANSGFWVLTYNEATTDLSDDSDGVSANLAEKYRVKIKVDTKLYYVGVADTTDTTAKINVTTTAEDKEATFNVGDVKKFDVNADDKYDISVTLNGVDSVTGKADLSLVYIQEPVSAEEQAGVEEQAGTTGTTPTTAKSKTWIWVVVVLAILAILGAILFGKKNSKHKNYGF